MLKINLSHNILFLKIQWKIKIQWKLKYHIDVKIIAMTSKKYLAILRIYRLSVEITSNNIRTKIIST